MKKLLISCGCSQAWGCNMADRSTRYAQVIADTYDMELLDVSKNGSSNEMISYQAVTAVNQALTTRTADQIVVLIGWTVQDRVDMHDHTDMKYQTMYVNLAEMAGSKKHDDRRVKIANFIRTHIWTEALGFLKQLHSINYAMAYCASQNVKQVHVFNLPGWIVPFPKMNRKDAYDQTVFTNIDCVVAPQFRSLVHDLYRQPSLYDLTSANPAKYHNSADDSHANDRGHSMWAQKIIDNNPGAFE